MATIIGPNDRLHVGKQVTDISTCFIVTSGGDIWIEDHAVIGWKVKFLCEHYDYSLRNIKTEDPPKSFEIRIGKGAWIGSCCVIVGPCTIGDNAVIGAGSVVVKQTVPANQLWAGNPAKFIRTIRFKD